MISEAPFFFSVTAVSVTLAGFSGLVAAFRRGDQLRSGDVFHLRGIAETGLANALIALSTIPIATLAGNLPTATRIVSAVVLVYVAVQIAVFAWRQQRMSIRVAVPQAAVAVAIDVGITTLAVVTIVLGSIGVYEFLLLLLLARPMWDFVRVLRDTTGPDVPAGQNERRRPD